MRRQQRNRRIFSLVIAALIVVALGVFLATELTRPHTFEPPTAATTFDAADLARIEEENGTPAPAEPAPSDRIIMTMDGDADTFVLLGEEYLEPGCHAFDPEQGNLSDVRIDGTVDTATPGDYTITYTATDSTGAEASVTRTVHVVESFDDFAGTATSLPVLMYHYVYTADNPPDEVNANYLLDSTLEAQLKYFTDNNYYYPSYQEVRAFAEGTHTLPARSVVLTFDDGEEGFLKYGIPLLNQYQVPATSFLIVSQEGTEEKLREYTTPYVMFQSHSYNLHRGGSDVGRGGIIHALSTEEIAEDLKQAQAVLGNTEAFAYPFGDNNENAWAAMDEAGVLCAFTIENRRVVPGDAPEALPRVRIAGDYTQEGFEYLVEPNGGEQ
jgi:Predicted xylanase/chitin deacetylase